MMEVPTSALSSTIKVGLQVISSHKRPVLEIYHRVCNRYGPEQEFDMPVGSDGTKTTKHRTRFQHIFIEFTLVNIGSVRAEDIDLDISGKLKRNPPREGYGGAFNSTIPQFAPGQTHFLFSFDEHDLNEYAADGGAPLGLKKDELIIKMSYNAPTGIVNWFLSLPSRLRRRKRFVRTYKFSPELVAGDLPPPEYA